MPAKSRSTFSQFIDVLGHAVAAASAVNHGRNPDQRTLKGLGIDPAQFYSIRKF